MSSFPNCFQLSRIRLPWTRIVVSMCSSKRTLQYTSTPFDLESPIDTRPEPVRVARVVVVVGIAIRVHVPHVARIVRKLKPNPIIHMFGNANIGLVSELSCYIFGRFFIILSWNQNHKSIFIMSHSSCLPRKILLPFLFGIHLLFFRRHSLLTLKLVICSLC